MRKNPGPYLDTVRTERQKIVRQFTPTVESEEHLPGQVIRVDCSFVEVKTESRIYMFAVGVINGPPRGLRIGDRVSVYFRPVKGIGVLPFIKT